MINRMLCVGAHPDDLEWYAGGTIAKLAQDNARITFVICTDGDKGSYDPQTDPCQLAAQRRIEQRGAAKQFGIDEIIFLGHADGELQANADLGKDLVKVYRKYQPNLLLAFDPWKRYELHPDHLAAGRAALQARLAAKMPLFHPDLHDQGLATWSIGEIWLFNAESPNHFVDVGTTMEIQRRALEQHRSQTTVWDATARTFIETQARENGKAIRVEYAEAFRRIVIEGALVVAKGT